MKKTTVILLFPILCLIGCKSNNLSNSMWYNATIVNNDGTWGTVVTSMYFFDDTVYTFNGVVVDDSVVISPYLYAVGKYTCKKTEKNIYNIQMDGKTNTGEPYQYSGQMNMKDLVMRLYFQGQKTNETYICDPNVKLETTKIKRR